MTTGLSHAPRRIKATEANTPYNPFWIDLSAEKNFKLDPNWMMPGIVVNWLLKEDDTGGLTRLILGIEAKKVSDMQAFIKRFFPNIKMKDADVEKLLLLGHPTLACEIRDGQTVQTVTQSGGDKGAYVKQNYSGILGGELDYANSQWKVNYNSGRYGDQHIKKSTDKLVTKTAVILCFKKYTGSDVKSA